MQILGEFEVAMDEAGAAELWLERGLELARREGFGAAEAVCIYSLGVTRWIRGDIHGAEELLTQSVELFRALEGSTERIPSPVNVAEMRTSDPTGPPGPRIVFEDTLQPFVEISCDAAIGYALANLASVARTRGDLARRAGAARRGAPSGSRRWTIRAAARRCSSAARTSSSRRARRRTRGRASSRRCCCGGS